ncbi:hypothetical protein HYU15_03860 [Candidatus Woesearchaeota archaeon]|nr:hypothetical protein [Candidatus Woesearchaeota archaeon]
MDSRLKANKNELLNHLSGGLDVNAPIKAAIMVRCTEDLEKALKEASDSANELSNRIIWLYRIIGGATIIGVIISAFMYFKK